MEFKKEDANNMFLNYSYRELKELFKKAKTSEEQDLYMALSNRVLQREQEKIIREH